MTVISMSVMMGSAFSEGSDVMAMMTVQTAVMKEQKIVVRSVCYSMRGQLCLDTRDSRNHYYCEV